MHIVIIGMRGCGKTSVGRELARRLDRPFHDLDELALDRFEEPSVRAVFDTHGEPAWRDAEAAALIELLDREDSPSVISLGGGAPMIDAVNERLSAAGATEGVAIVWLRCKPITLERRLRSRPGDRPGLTGDDVVGELRGLLDARTPRYRALAHVVVDVDDTRAPTAAQRVEAALTRRMS